MEKHNHILKKLNGGELSWWNVYGFLSFSSYKVSNIHTHSTMKVLHHSTSSECGCAFPCSLPNLPKVSCNSMQWSRVALQLKIRTQANSNSRWFELDTAQSWFVFKFILISICDEVFYNVLRLEPCHQNERYCQCPEIDDRHKFWNNEQVLM